MLDRLRSILISENIFDPKLARSLAYITKSCVNTSSSKDALLSFINCAMVSGFQDDAYSHLITHFGYDCPGIQELLSQYPD